MALAACRSRRVSTAIRPPTFITCWRRGQWTPCRPTARCGGATGFLNAAAQAQGANVPLSAHTAPALHASLASALPNVVNVEYFFDHIRIESMFFDGVPELRDGSLYPDRSQPGLGLTFKAAEAQSYLQSEWRSS